MPASPPADLQHTHVSHEASLISCTWLKSPVEDSNWEVSFSAHNGGLVQRSNNKMEVSKEPTFFNGD